MKTTLKVLLFVLFFSGCASSGFKKRATLIPDSISIGVGRDRGDGEYKGYDSTYYYFEATWYLQ